MSKCKPELPMPTEADIQRLVMRYFIIFFTAGNENQVIQDSVNVECKGFPNCAEIIRGICEIHSAEWCSITGIKELTQQDYSDWDAEEFEEGSDGKNRS